MADDEEIREALTGLPDDVLQEIVDAEDLDVLRPSLPGDLGAAEDLATLKTLAAEVQDGRASAPTIVGLPPTAEDD